MSSTPALVLFAASASTSATLPASAASSWNPLNILAAMSVATARLVPDDAAKSKLPGNAATISFVVKPADARFSIAIATSLALKAVLAPRSNATSFSFSSSSPVAPEIACTLLICASKSIPNLVAAAPIPTIGVVTYLLNVSPTFFIPSPIFPNLSVKVFI